MAKKVRILVDIRIDGVPYKPNQVVEVSDAMAASLKKSGEGDPDAAAVKYCLSQGEQVIVHKAPEAEPETAETGDEQKE